MLELDQLGLAKIGDFAIGKAAQDQVHLTGAAVPATEQQPLAAVIQSAARSCRSRHPLNPIRNAKSPDVPGGVDIATRFANVSMFSCIAFAAKCIQALDDAVVPKP